MWTHLESGPSMFVVYRVFFLLTDTAPGGRGGGVVTLGDSGIGLREIAVGILFCCCFFLVANSSFVYLRCKYGGRLSWSNQESASWLLRRYGLINQVAASFGIFRLKFEHYDILATFPCSG